MSFPPKAHTAKYVFGFDFVAVRYSTDDLIIKWRHEGQEMDITNNMKLNMYILTNVTRGGYTEEFPSGKSTCTKSTLS